jgi:hypothetical protein
MCRISIMLDYFQRFFRMEEIRTAGLIYQIVYSLNSNLDESDSTKIQVF